MTSDFGNVLFESMKLIDQQVTISFLWIEKLKTVKGLVTSFRYGIGGPQPL